MPYINCLALGRDWFTPLQPTIVKFEGLVVIKKTIFTNRRTKINIFKRLDVNHVLEVVKQFDRWLWGYGSINVTHEAWCSSCVRVKRAHTRSGGWNTRNCCFCSLGSLNTGGSGFSRLQFFRVPRPRQKHPWPGGSSFIIE